MDVAVGPGPSSLVYVSVQSHLVDGRSGVAVSADQGETWAFVNRGLGRSVPSALAVDATGTPYAATYVGAFAFEAG